MPFTIRVPRQLDVEGTCAGVLRGTHGSPRPTSCSGERPRAAPLGQEGTRMPLSRGESSGRLASRKQTAPKSERGEHSC